MTLEDSSEDQTGWITGGTPATDGRGGCFYLENGSLIMNGGTIGPSASGGGIYVKYKDSSFVMHGGRITKNKASAISVWQGSFRMTGGEITGNSADDGGGIYAWGSANINIEGGKITGNRAACGGRYPYTGSCSLSYLRRRNIRQYNLQCQFKLGRWRNWCLMGQLICNRRSHHRQYYKRYRRRYPRRGQKHCLGNWRAHTLEKLNLPFGKSDVYAVKGVNLTLLSASSMKRRKLIIAGMIVKTIRYIKKRSELPAWNSLAIFMHGTRRS